MYSTEQIMNWFSRFFSGLTLMLVFICTIYQMVGTTINAFWVSAIKDLNPPSSGPNWLKLAATMNWNSSWSDLSMAQGGLKLSSKSYPSIVGIDKTLEVARLSPVLSSNISVTRQIATEMIESIWVWYAGIDSFWVRLVKSLEDLNDGRCLRRQTGIGSWKR